MTDIGPSLRRADYGYDVESDFLSEMLEFDVVVDGLLQTLPLVPVDGTEKVCTVKMYRECFSIGIPMLISALLAPVLFYIVNTLVIERLGADGMYIFTVFFQINGLGLLVLSGSNTAITNIGGILIGEEDHDSFRLLTKRIFRLLTVVMLVESLLMFLFPEVLAWMFGATDSLIEQSHTPFRLMCLAPCKILYISIQMIT